MIQQKPLVSNTYFIVHRNNATDLLTRAPCSVCGKRVAIDKTASNGHVLQVSSSLSTLFGLFHLFLFRSITHVIVGSLSGALLPRRRTPR